MKYPALGSAIMLSLLCITFCTALAQQKDTGNIHVLLKKADTLVERQEYLQALPYAKQAFSWSTGLSFDRGLVESSFSIGKIYKYLEKGDSAKFYFNECSKYALQLLDSLTAGKCMQQVAYLYQYKLLFNNDSAIHYHKALLQFPVKQDAAFSNQLYFDIGYSYYQRVLVDSALKYIFLSQQLAEKRKDTSLIVLSLCINSAIWNSTQHYPQAQLAIENAISLLNHYSANPPELFIVANISQGWIYERSKNYDSLLLNIQALLPVLRKKNDPYYLNLMYYRLAVYYNSINQPNKSLNILKDSLQNGTENDINFLSSVYREMGKSYALKDSIQQAINYLNKSINNARFSNDPGELMETYDLLWQVYRRENRYKPAMEAYIQYNFFKDSIVNIHNLASMNLLGTQYELKKKEDRITFLSAENDLKTILAQEEGQRKKMAITGIIITALIGCCGFLWLRKKKRSQNLQNLMNERLRISRELHDEVGATLSGVAMYIHLTKSQLQSGYLEEVKNSLDIMQDSSVQMVNKLNDIVWLINPNNSALSDLMARLEEYAINMTTAKNMDLKLNIEKKAYEHSLSMEQRRSIYLFCKEAINNAVKYSEGTILELSVKKEGDLLSFVIHDNGKGFDRNSIKRGNGLKNLQQRANESDGVYFIQTEEGRGCTLSLQLNIA